MALAVALKNYACNLSNFITASDIVSVDTVPGMSVDIVTLNYPSRYPSNSNIEWKMRVEDSGNKTLTVTVNAFQVRTPCLELIFQFDLFW